MIKRKSYTEFCIRDQMLSLQPKFSWNSNNKRTSPLTILQITPPTSSSNIGHVHFCSLANFKAAEVQASET
uniref:Uncharacterized protein n=1 Tax=Octopus bimaculoides TaxID=37653 RepID=A0A0L8GWC1_OCTBM